MFFVCVVYMNLSWFSFGFWISYKIEEKMGIFFVCEIVFEFSCEIKF